MTWHVYMVRDGREIDAVLEMYRKVYRQLPVLAKVSVKADPALGMLLKKHGVRVVEDRTVLPKDVWLTHEEA